MNPPYKIESDVPRPVARGERDSKWSFIRRMRVDQSFVVPTPAERNCALIHATQHKIVLQTLKLNGSGYRIWRIA